LEQETSGDSPETDSIYRRADGELLLKHGALLTVLLSMTGTSLMSGGATSLEVFEVGQWKPQALADL
jgi:hypothetical protein